MPGSGTFDCRRCGHRVSGSLKWILERLDKDEVCKDHAACYGLQNRTLSAPDAVERALDERIKAHVEVCESRNGANVRAFTRDGHEIRDLVRRMEFVEERVDGLVNVELEEERRIDAAERISDREERGVPSEGEEGGDGGGHRDS